MVELSDGTNAVAVKGPEPMITKIDGNSMSHFGCAKCKCTLRNIETLRRADGNVLQLLTCCECNYKWKEVWWLGETCRLCLKF